jgi:hypothetical protein
VHGVVFSVQCMVWCTVHGVLSPHLICLYPARTQRNACHFLCPQLRCEDAIHHIHACLAAPVTAYASGVGVAACVGEHVVDGAKARRDGDDFLGAGGWDPSAQSGGSKSEQAKQYMDLLVEHCLH